jgi:hypothetical protein
MLKCSIGNVYKVRRIKNIDYTNNRGKKQVKPRICAE